MCLGPRKRRSSRRTPPGDTAAPASMRARSQVCVRRRQAGQRIFFILSCARDPLHDNCGTQRLLSGTNPSKYGTLWAGRCAGRRRWMPRRPRAAAGTAAAAAVMAYIPLDDAHAPANACDVVSLCCQRRGRGVPASPSLRKQRDSSAQPAHTPSRAVPCQCRKTSSLSSRTPPAPASAQRQQGRSSSGAPGPINRCRARPRVRVAWLCGAFNARMHGMLNARVGRESRRLEFGGCSPVLPSSNGHSRAPPRACAAAARSLMHRIAPLNARQSSPRRCRRRP